MTKRWLIIAVAASVSGVLVAGCGGGGSSSSRGGGGGGDATGREGNVTIDLGAQKLEVPKGKPKIAFFTAGSDNDILKVLNETAERVASEKGVELTVFDPGFNEGTQYAQIQNALQRDEYDAYIVTPLNGEQQCKLLTEQAPDAGVVVSVLIVPICDRTLNVGEEIWAPGTLNFVEAHDLQTYQNGWMKQVSKMLPGEHHIGVLLGPPLIGLSQTFKRSLEALEKERPELHIEAEMETDYTTPDGLAKTQTMLQAHPQIDAVFAVYSDLARGAIKAIQADGRSGQIKLFDEGGSTADIEEITAGELTATSEFNPVRDSIVSIEQVIDAFEGQEGPHFFGYLDTQGSEEAPYMITKANVEAFDPTY